MNQYPLLPEPGRRFQPPVRAGASPSYAERLSRNAYRVMAEDLDDEASGLIQYWRLLLRHKGLLSFMTALGGLAAVLLTVPQTPVYRAKTSLEVQSLNDNFLNMRELSPTAVGPSFSPDYDLQTQTRILQSRILLDRLLANRNDLARRLVASHAHTRASLWRKAIGVSSAEGSPDRDSIAADAAARLRVHAQPNTRIIEIAFDSTDPKLAADFSNAVASEFVELSLEQRWRSNQHTGEWLGRQMQDIKIKLEKSEEELQRYARAANLVITSEKNNVVEERLRQLQEELSKAQADRVARQSKYELATTVGVESLPEVLDDQTLREYQVQLTTLRRELADLRASFTPAHPKVQKVQAQIAAVESALENKRSNIVKRVRNEYEAARRRENLLTADYSSQARLMSEQADKVAHYNILKREVDTTRQLYESMFQRVKEAGVAAALRASNINVIDPARPPRSPYKPSFTLNTLFGLAFGMFAGVAIVFVRERADRTIQAPGDTALSLTVPELGVIPADETERRKRRAGRSHSRLLTGSDPDRLELATFNRSFSVVADAFRATLTSILFSQPNGEHPRVIVVSSALPGEGKTTVASNLAIALAQANHRVLLVDGDMRRPRLHDVFEVDNRVGLSEILAGKTMLTIRETKVPGLFLLPSGGIKDANLLFAPAVGELLTRLRTEFDMIVMDTPPLLQMPDARVLGRHSDAVILVVRAEQTTRDAAKLARERLHEDGTYLIGTILTDWRPDRTSHAYGYYSTYYHNGKGQAA